MNQRPLQYGNVDVVTAILTRYLRFYKFAAICISATPNLDNVVTLCPTLILTLNFTSLTLIPHHLSLLSSRLIALSSHRSLVSSQPPCLHAAPDPTQKLLVNVVYPTPSSPANDARLETAREEPRTNRTTRIGSAGQPNVLKRVGKRG